MILKNSPRNSILYRSLIGNRRLTFMFHNPGTIQWDMNVSRLFPIKERYKIEFRGEFFNIMNHANWNGPSAAVNSATFGQITSFSGPRLIQLALKLYF